MLSDFELKELAGSAAFARGRSYHAEGRVRLLRQGAEQIEAEAKGSELYRLWLKREKGEWRWGCACPAAADGSFCKHLVAAAMVWRDGMAKPRPDEQDKLLGYLHKQPAARLARWLAELAHEDSDVARRLKLHQSEGDPAKLKKALSDELGTSGFLDYHRSMDYARRLGPVLIQLRELTERDPAAGRELCDYALKRLFRIYARADDSAGAIGECLAELARLHADACRLAPGDGTELARQLYKLQTTDEWGLFPIGDYWEALGEQGHKEYAGLINQELATLPAKPTEEHDSEHFYIRQRAVAYTRAARDFGLLMHVLQWDLSHAMDYLEIINACREFGREREAMQWAERSVRRFGGDAQLRDALADCLQTAGLEEETIEQRWQAFCLESDAGHWDALKKAAGVDWMPWREKALASLADNDSEATQCVELLMHDEDLPGALQAARARPLYTDTLARLAQRLESTDGTAAGELYLRVARHLEERLSYKQYPLFTQYAQRIVRLLPESAWRTWMNGVLTRHGRKTRLMAMFAEKGLKD
ncbi:MAG: SWIM zinc finger family protein [Terriglobia bacterium]